MGRGYAACAIRGEFMLASYSIYRLNDMFYSAASGRPGGHRHLIGLREVKL
jgi:hypothetical protein